MIYAEFTIDHVKHSEMFSCWDEYNKATFNPETELICLIEIKPNRKYRYAVFSDNAKTMEVK